MPSFQEEERMGMALGLTLIAVGAILNLAVTVRSRWIDVAAVGAILLFVGLFTFGVYLWLAVLRRRPYRPRAEAPRYREEYVEEDRTARRPGGYVGRTYDDRYDGDRYDDARGGGGYADGGDHEGYGADGGSRDDERTQVMRRPDRR